MANVRTHIASGNVVFSSVQCGANVKAALEAELCDYAGKPVGVFVRTGAEMAQIVADSPIVNHPSNRTKVVFLDAPPAPHARAQARHMADEQLAIGTREIHVGYGGGMRDSKLKIPAAKDGNACDMHIVAKLAAMANDQLRRAGRARATRGRETDSVKSAVSLLLETSILSAGRGY